MHERTRSILEAAVRDFIKSGKPITSEYLYDIHDFGIKPAMIRWELNDLAEHGFFYQTHPSGGRFPTDKAYQFFVDEMLEDGADQGSSSSLFASAPDDMKHFVHEIADYLKLLSVGYDIREGMLYGSGLRALLGHLGADSLETITDAVGDFESIEERLSKRREWWEEETLWPKVFVGPSPITRSTHLSVVAGKMECDGREILMLTIGPKRMDYQKTVHLFKSLGKKKKKRTNAT